MNHDQFSQQAQDENIKKANSLTPQNSMVHTFWNNKVYQGYGATKEGFMVDTAKIAQAMKLKAEGKDYANILKGAYSDKYKEMYPEFAKVLKIKEENPYISVDQIIGSAGITGPLVINGFVNIAAINDLAEVKGPQHDIAQYNSIKAIPIKAAPNFYFRGFVRSSILNGQADIGDDVVPDPVKNAFTFFEVDLKPDSFRYETTMRERAQVGFDIVAQYNQDVAAALLKLKDTKVITAVNAITPTAATGVIDTLTSGLWTNDASIQFAKGETALRTYGGAEFVLWTMAVARAYDRNVGGVPPVTSNIGQPESTVPRYQKTLSKNTNLLGLENEGVTAKYAAVLSRQWASFYQGAEIQISYMNQMTPGQLEGRIYFNFNKMSVELPSAGILYSGVTS